MTKKHSTPLPKVPQNFAIVGLGASAGGVEAFQQFVRKIPLDSGMAYILVLHLPANHESLLPAILSKSTQLPVLEITDDINLVPDHIYTIPENKILITVDGVLKLLPRHTSQPINYSIDIFFNSLGEAHQNNAVGIVLSGTGSDGTLGLKAIKKYGGVTFAQEPSSATFPQMPQSAIAAAGTVDFVLLPEDMPAQLVKLRQAVNNNFPDEDEKAIPRNYEEILKQIIFLIRQHKGIDFSYYKESTLRRRIARRMGLCRYEEVADYYEFLKNNKEELDLLLKDFLIPVTSFFRDPKTFQSLTEKIYPHLLESKLSQSTIRVWVAGCSSGEEAYSIAISLHEFLSKRAPDIKIQVFATDISESNIAKARSGTYNALDVQAIPPHLLEAYFVKTDATTYQINKTIRNCCVFAVHNFLKDPPFSKIDLVSCRNVLIYMTTFLQKKALTTFHYALKEKGVLWLGKSETANVVSDLFTLITNHDKFFSRKYTTSHFTQDSSESMDEARSFKNDTIHTPMISQTDFQKNADEILLNHYTPPCVIVSDQNDIIHFRGDTSLFFMPSPGKASLNVLKMVRKELAFDLRNLLHKAHIEKETVFKENILLKHGHESYLVSIEVIPLLQSVALHFLIVFNKRAVLPMWQESSKGSKKTKKSLAELHIEQLEKELAQMRQDILNITENQEAANEELQNANEELLSSSEELQTLNEELETSKEELQSGNEELITMNQELINRQEHLSRTQAQLEELNKQLVIQNKAFEGAQVSSKMGSMTWNLHTDEFTYSDNLFRIFGYKPKEFVPSVKKLKGFVHPDDLPDLEQISKKLLLKKKISELSFRAYTKDGSLKYIKGTGSVINFGHENMLVASLQDITEDVLLNRNLQLREAQLSESQRIGKIGSWEIDFLTDTILWSDETYRLYGYKPNEIKIDFETFGRVHPEDIEKLRAVIENSRTTGEAFEAEYRRYDKNNDLHYIYSKGNVRKDKKGKAVGMLCISIDITELRLKEQKLRETYQQLESKNLELEHSNAELASFSYIASHDLGDPLYKIQAFTERILLKEELSDTAKDYFSRIIRSTQRMKSLLSDLLNFSRMTTDEVIFAKTDLNTLLEEAKISLSERIDEKKAVIEADNLPTLTIIPTQVYQLFSNMLSNSIKYSKPDVPPHIVIKASLIPGNEITDSRALNNKNYWKLTFTDNGIGFEQQYEQKIFELFQRLHGKTEYSGTGIGLTICRKVVQNHEGLIEAFGQPNVGATFNIYIPEREK